MYTIEKSNIDLARPESMKQSLMGLNWFYGNKKFKEETGFEVGTRYSLPRITKEHFHAEMPFPQMILSHSEAIDRYCDENSRRLPYLHKNYFRKIGTMLPEKERGGDFSCYAHTTFIAKKDYEAIMEALIVPSQKMGLSMNAGDNLRLEYIVQCFLNEMEEWLENQKDLKCLDRHMEPLYFVRKRINDRLHELFEPSIEQRHRNLTVGMIRYHVGNRTDDHAGD